MRDRTILPRIGIAPRNLKGGYGRTRWVPILPELERALRSHLAALGLKFTLTPAFPLFPSRQAGPDGSVRPLAHSQAQDLIKAVFAKAGIVDDGRLGTHTLRKTFAKNVYRNSGNDIMVPKAALNHADVSATQKYLEAGEAEVLAAIAKCDFTRRPRKVAPLGPLAA
jgi:integrase